VLHARGLPELVVPPWYRLHRPMRPGTSPAPTTKTSETRRDVSTRASRRLGAERSLVQIQSPRPDETAAIAAVSQVEAWRFRDVRGPSGVQFHRPATMVNRVAETARRFVAPLSYGAPEKPVSDDQVVKLVPALVEAARADQRTAERVRPAPGTWWSTPSMCWWAAAAQVDGTPCVAAAVGDVGAPEQHVGGHRAVAGDVGELGSPPGPGSATRA
jgi:hypothetical protein